MNAELMRISQSADITAIAGQNILDLSVEEYLNMHLANKRIVERANEQTNKSVKKIKRR